MVLAFLCILGIKIIRTHVIIRLRKFILNAFNEINNCQLMIFRLYTAYNRHKMTEIVNQTNEKSQVLSPVLQKFCNEKNEGTL